MLKVLYTQYYTSACSALFHNTIRHVAIMLAKVPTMVYNLFLTLIKSLHCGTVRSFMVCALKDCIQCYGLPTAASHHKC